MAIISLREFLDNILPSGAHVRTERPGILTKDLDKDDIMSVASLVQEKSEPPDSENLLSPLSLREKPEEQFS